MPRPLILNDSFGALSVALHRWQPQFNSDSYLAHRALIANLKRNRIDIEAVERHTPFEQPSEPVELLLIKIPKTLAMLEDQLHRLRPLLTPNCRILAGAMVKHLPKAAFTLFERLIGPTHSSLAKKKARLLFAQLDPALQPGPSPYPSSYTLEQSSYRISNHAGVFSREKLDIGTRLLLQHIPASSAARTIVDLGCGNGLVGLIAAERNPNAELIFTDESYRALESARLNFAAAFGPQRDAQFIADNCLEQMASNSAELILNNPPFHQQQAVGDHIARQMFRDARRVLAPGGELWVIGNRHLGYHQQLRKLFGNCELIASNPKFVVLKAQKRNPS